MNKIDGFSTVFIKSDYGECILDIFCRALKQFGVKPRNDLEQLLLPDSSFPDSARRMLW